MTRRWALYVALAAGLPLATPFAQQPAAASRVIGGHVRDASGFPVRGAQVAVTDATDATDATGGAAGAATSDSSGRYRLPGLTRGALQLIARRLGFAPETLEVAAGAVALSRADFVLSDPVDHMPAVLVRASASLDFLAGFRERARSGRGRFFTNEDIMRRGFTRMSDVMRSVPGGMSSTRRSIGRQEVRLRGSRQAPLVWLDGVPLGIGSVDLDAYDPRTFAGVEIYMGAATVPVQFAGTPTMSSSGGAILLWSLRGEARPRPAPRDKRTPAAALVQDLLARGEAFRSTEVDEIAAPVGGPDALVPAYPEPLRHPGARGTIVVEFVVDSAGAVRMPTFGVVLTSHPLLVDPVREVLVEQRFTPARRAGRPVAQVLLLPFTFAADSTRPVARPER